MAANFIKHTSQHFYKLGPTREFFDTEHFLTPEQEATILAVQEMFGELNYILQEMYNAKRAGIGPQWFKENIKLPSWLQEQEEMQDVRDFAAGSSNSSQSPQPDPSSTNQTE